ncbi:hypothetical protein [Streptomyces griseoviridis]|uniref:hypothetical protein n=1 Tax=Streptomyces griseoviridis TaxID=45398 RepID=UPI0013E3FEE9|nr:hypothetical protein [Streptomyces griseoviridis]
MPASIPLHHRSEIAWKNRAHASGGEARLGTSPLGGLDAIVQLPSTRVEMTSAVTAPWPPAADAPRPPGRDGASAPAAPGTRRRPRRPANRTAKAARTPTDDRPPTDDRITGDRPLAGGRPEPLLQER